MKDATRLRIAAVIGGTALLLCAAPGQAIDPGEGLAAGPDGVASKERGSPPGGPVRGLIPDHDPGNDTQATADSFDLNMRNVMLCLGELVSNSDVDHFTFPLAANDAITVVTTPLRFLPSSFSTPDTIVQILNSGGASLVQNDDAGSDNTGFTPRGSVLRFVAPVAGNYTIRVRSFANASSGPYLMTVARATGASDWIESFNDTPAFANPFRLDLTGPLSATMYTANLDPDFMSVPMRTGDVLTATTVPIYLLPASFGAPDMQVAVLDTDGTTILVQSLDDGAGQSPNPAGTNLGATVRFRAPTNGVYYVRAFSNAPDAIVREFRMVMSLLPGEFCAGDADGSGQVNFADVTTVLQNWLTNCR